MTDSSKHSDSDKPGNNQVANPLVAKVTSEAIRRSMGKPSMPDEDFEELVKEFYSQPVDETKDPIESIKYCWKQLSLGLLTIMPLIDKPYADDSRWTPYSRWIKTYHEALDIEFKKLTTLTDVVASDPNATTSVSNPLENKPNPTKEE